MSAAIRPPAVAGTFYPGSPAALADVVDGYLAEPGRFLPSDVPARAFVVPHAGYVYSAPVAAHAYARVAALRGLVDRVVIQGPSHRAWLNGAPWARRGRCCPSRWGTRGWRTWRA